jgi:hypothetical protein
MIDLYGVDPTLVTEIVRIDVFISHDTARDGSHMSALGLLAKLSSAL